MKRYKHIRFVSIFLIITFTSQQLVWAWPAHTYEVCDGLRPVAAGEKWQIVDGGGLRKKMQEFFYCKSGIPDEATQSSRGKDPVIWDREDCAHTFFFQNYMRAVTGNGPTCSFKGLNRVPAGDIGGKFGHLYRYFKKNFFFMFGFFPFRAPIQDLQAALNRIFNIFTNFFQSFPLADASGNRRAFGYIPAIFLFNNNLIFHISPLCTNNNISFYQSQGKFAVLHVNVTFASQQLAWAYSGFTPGVYTPGVYNGLRPQAAGERSEEQERRDNAEHELAIMRGIYKKHNLKGRRVLDNELKEILDNMAKQFQLTKPEKESLSHVFNGLRKGLNIQWYTIPVKVLRILVYILACETDKDLARIQWLDFRSVQIAFLGDMTLSYLYLHWQTKFKYNSIRGPLFVVIYKSIGLPDYTPLTTKEWFAAKEKGEIPKFGGWRRVPDDTKVAFLQVVAKRAGLESAGALNTSHLEEAGLAGLYGFYMEEGDTPSDGVSKLMAELKMPPVSPAQVPSVNLEEEIEKYKQGKPARLDSREVRRGIVEIALKEMQLLNDEGKIADPSQKLSNFFLTHRFNGLNRRSPNGVYHWYIHRGAAQNRPEGIKVGEYILYNLGFVDDEDYQRLVSERRESLPVKTNYTDWKEAERVFESPRINSNMASSPRHPDDPVEVYNWRAQRYRPLTPEEEEKLLQLVRQGNDTALQVFVEHYSGPILHCAQMYVSKYKGYPEVDLAVLCHAGEMGVRRGVCSFKPEKGLSLHSWLTGSGHQGRFRGTIVSKISDTARHLSGRRRKGPRARTGIDIPEIQASTERLIDTLEGDEILEELIRSFISAIRTLATTEDEQLNERNKKILYSLFGVDKAHKTLIIQQDQASLAAQFQVDPSRISQIKHRFIQMLIITDEGKRLAFLFLNDNDRKRYGLLDISSLNRSDLSVKPARERKLRFAAADYKNEALLSSILRPRAAWESRSAIAASSGNEGQPRVCLLSRLRF